MTQRISKAAIIILAIFVLLFIVLFVNRNNILRYVVGKKLASVERELDLEVGYDRLSMSGLDKVELNGFRVIPRGRDTILTLKKLLIDINPFSILDGRLVVNKANIEMLHLNFVKRDSISNYDFLFKKRETHESNENVEKNYSQSANNLLRLVFGFLPENGEISNMTVCQKRDSSYTGFAIPSLKIKESHFYGYIFIDDNGCKSKWSTKGLVDSHHNELEACVKPASPTKNITIPYINRYYDAVVSFDYISFSLKGIKEHSVENLSGNAVINGLHMYHPRLSPDTITVNKGKLAYNINIGNNYVELDSASTIIVNELSFNPYIKASKENKWHVKASINQSPFESQKLFSSLPSALFQHLRGVKTTGTFTYSFLLDVDFNNIDSLKFHSILRGQNFHIKDYGNSDLTKMNREFLYTAYDNDVPVRTFFIGGSNPDYRSIDSISPLLKNAILQSEDNGFMYHNGFLPGAIQEALVHDFKVKRFARGGSTISMQLVKNVFLTRHKNIARKLEEALMVWLIENQHLTSKNRMFEVYLNIIEWGPLIYGAKEASEYYFGKEPMDLNLEEAIFLASLIPRPKQFRSFFNPDGSLRGNEGYFKMIAHRLSRNGIISEEEAETVCPHVVLNGRAKSDIIKDEPSDSIVAQPLIETDSGLE